MPWNARSQHHLLFGHKQTARGFTLLIVVILISAVLSSLLVGTTLFALSHLETTSVRQESVEARYAMEGCVAESLLRLKRDGTNGVGTFSFDDVVCVLNISGSGNLYTLTLQSSVGEYSRTSTATFTLLPFAITGWE